MPKSQNDLFKSIVPDGNIAIVKFIEWHAYVGKVFVNPEGGYVRVTHPKCIRDWGATKGLGELYNGPLASTALDLAGAITIPMSSVICVMEVDQKKWAGKIAKSEHGGD